MFSSLKKNADKTYFFENLGPKHQKGRPEEWLTMVTKIGVNI